FLTPRCCAIDELRAGVARSLRTRNEARPKAMKRIVRGEQEALDVFGPRSAGPQHCPEQRGHSMRMAGGAGEENHRSSRYGVRPRDEDAEPLGHPSGQRGRRLLEARVNEGEWTRSVVQRFADVDVLGEFGIRASVLEGASREEPHEASQGGGGE